MTYDVIIVGGGPAGLFTACNIDKKLKVLVLEKNKTLGIKFLMSGGGQCNITHGGNIKNFLKHYGNNGQKIRQILYKFNNQQLIKFFKDRGINFVEREDKKIFPASFKAADILDVLLKVCKNNGVDIKYESNVENVTFINDKSIFKVISNKKMYESRHFVLAAGGCSYPTTGSDGSGFNLGKQLGIKITKIKPSLVPIYVKDYHYSELAGLSYKDINVQIFRENKKIREEEGDILFTHDCLSGPLILNLSRYLKKKDIIRLNYLNEKIETIKLSNFLKNKGKIQINTALKEFTNLSKKHIDLILKNIDINHEKKCSQINNIETKNILSKIILDEFEIVRNAGFNKAMATCGGIDLNDIDLKTLSAKNNKRLWFVGEIIDIDGDTGGYNLQFAFSSAKKCAENINNICISV